MPGTLPGTILSVAGESVKVQIEDQIEVVKLGPASATTDKVSKYAYLRI